MPRIAIVEDHGLIAQTVATALLARGNEVRVVDPRETADIVGTVLAEPPELVLLDLDLGPAGDATRLIEEFREAGSAVVIVTGVDDRIRHSRCVAAGAAGVVSKSTSFDALLRAIETALAEGTLLSQHEREEHLRRLREHARAEGERLGPFEELTPREAEVLGDLVQGRSVNEIAERAFVSVATVRSQVRSILAKLDAPSQVAAIGRARQAGWVPPQEEDGQR